MKKTTILFLFLAMFLINYSQTTGQSPNWQWIKNIPSVDGGTPSGIATDVTGNVYITGTFFTTITFGNITLQSTGFPADSIADIFIAKFDPSGNIIWAKKAGYNSYDYSCSISIDAACNFYITCWSYGPTIIFGTDTITTPSGTYYHTIYLTKFDSSGNVLWVRTALSYGYNGSFPNNVATDLSGNVYITGHFSDSLSFGSTTIINTVTNDYHMFVAKYDSSGNLKYAYSANGTASSIGSGISTDSIGNVYITGSFSYYMTIGNVGLYSGTYGNIFVIKLDSAGHAIWGRCAGNNYSSNIDSYSIVTDYSGNSYITGYFEANLNFGSNIIIHTSGVSDVFLAKYDTYGNILWAKDIGGYDHDYGNSVWLDANNNVYLTGKFSSLRLKIGSDTIFNFNTVQSSHMTYDIFIAKFDSSGQIQWSKSAGGIYDDDGLCITTDKLGNIYHTGTYRSPAVFGNDTLTNGNLFFAKIGNISTNVISTENKTNILLYPNPSSSYFSISIPKQTKLITIYNSQGRLIEKRPVFNQMDLNFNIKENGIFFIQIVTDRETITKKLVINNE